MARHEANATKLPPAAAAGFGLVVVAVVALLTVGMSHVSPVATATSADEGPNTSVTPVRPPFSIEPIRSTPTFQPVVKASTLTAPDVPTCDRSSFGWVVSSSGEFSIGVGLINATSPLTFTLTSRGHTWTQTYPPGQYPGGSFGQSPPPIAGLTTSSGYLVMSSGAYSCLVEPSS